MYRYLHDNMFAYSGVQDILCCVFCFFPSCAWWCPTHIVLYIFVFLALSCVTNVASFFLLSILDCPFGFSYVYLKQMVLVYDIMVM